MQTAKDEQVHKVKSKNPGVRQLLLGGLIAIAVFFGILIATSVGLVDALSITMVVALQSLAGIFVWLLVRKKATTVLETLGVGIALGVIATVLVGLLFLPAQLSFISGFVFPASVIVLLTILKSVGHLHFPEITAIERVDIVALILGLGVGVFVLAEFWAFIPLGGVPLPIVGDPAFHESLSNSLAIYGPSDWIASEGDVIKYHWFSHTWMGFTQVWSHSAPYVVSTRALPLVALMVSVFIAVAWTSRLVTARWARVLIAVMIPAAYSLGPLARPLSLDTILLPRSPSQLLGIALSLVVAFLIFEYIFRRLDQMSLVLIALGSFVLIGVKSTAGLILCVGLVGLIFWSLYTHRARRRVVVVVAVAYIATAAGYFFTTYGASSQDLIFKLVPNLDKLGFEVPDSPLAGTILGAVYIVLWVGAPVGISALCLWSRDESVKAVAWFAVPMGCAGLVAILTLAHDALSQYYFIVSAYPILLVASVCGIATLIKRCPEVTVFQLLLAVFSGAFVQVLVFYTWLANGNIPRGYGIVALWVALVLIALAIVWASRSLGKGTRIKAFVLILAISLVSGMVVRSVVASEYALQEQLRANRTVAVDSNALAGDWLRENSGDGLVATNRFCDRAGEVPPDCKSRSYPITALSGKHALIEGLDYRLGRLSHLTPLERRRVEASFSFVDKPSCTNSRFLWDEGVRYVWVDLEKTEKRNWEPYATVRFTSPQVWVLQLNDVPCRS